MAENKTKETDSSVQAFLEGVEDPRKREDSLALVQMMEAVTGEPAKMWGSAIVGFGSYHYKYESGREGDNMLIGFSPRKDNFALYGLNVFDGYEDMLVELGKYKTGKSCLYVKALKDVDVAVLKDIIERATEKQRENHSA
jgi:hypothetical protein